MSLLPDECPRCKSKRLTYVDVGGFAYAIVEIKCSDCGWEDSVVDV